MITKKDRKIANQEVMIKNRDKLLKYQTEKVAKLEAILRQVSVIASNNKYGNERAYLANINELVRPFNQN